MKKFTKILIGILAIVYAFNVYASENTKKIVELSCKNSQGQEVSIGSECTSGNSACVENGCPKGTGEL